MSKHVVRWRAVATLVVAAALFGVLALVAPSPAGAAHHVVTSAADSGPGTYRQAVADAEDDTDEVAIFFAPGLTVNLESSITYGGTQDIVVTGPVTFDGDDQHQVLVTTGGHDVTFDSVTVRDAGGAGGPALETVGDVDVYSSSFTSGSSAEPGGAVRSVGEVYVDRSTFSDNASEGDGGALASQTDRIDAYRSTFIDNESGGDGGAIHSTVRVGMDRSTFDGNVAEGNGGAAAVTDASEGLFVRRSTFVRNEAVVGGAVFVAGDISGTTPEVVLSTFTGNVATAEGGALALPDSFIDLDASTFSGNSAAAGAQVLLDEASARGTIFSQPLGGGASCDLTDMDSDHSWDTGTSCLLATGGDDEGSTQNGANPQLGALRDNGGDAPTMLPAASSPIVDQIPAEDGECATPPSLFGDQRDRPRPGSWEEQEVDVCDIGAVERSEQLFADVADGHPFFGEIAIVSVRGLSTGYPGSPLPTYRPAANVTRQAMSAFLYRLADEPTFPDPAQGTFADVSPANAFFTEIEWMAAEGISTGYAGSPKPTYRPSAVVSRQAMSAFLHRFGDPEDEFEPPATPTFTDVGTGHPFFVDVEWMADAGVSTGYQPGPTYKPSASVSRQAMSAFLARMIP
jgi:hypothetical protein